MWLGWLEGAAGRFEPARARLRDARRLLTELGHGAALVRDWVLAATDVELLAGEPEAAESLLREACDELDRAGDSAWLATLTAVLAEAVYAQGRFPEALALSQTALELATRGDLAAELGWRCARAKALARAGEVAEGETLAREALALLAGTDVPGERAKALLALAEVLRIDGRGADADAAAAEAAALLARKGYAVQRKRREPGARAPSLGPTV
jgi:ATP/maltotriose-dependent transcriptional regulator MalT